MHSHKGERLSLADCTDHRRRAPTSQAPSTSASAYMCHGTEECGTAINLAKALRMYFTWNTEYSGH